MHDKHRFNAHYQISEIEHRYGERIHILSDPFLTTHLARLCSPETGQPQFNELVSILYTSLIRTVINAEFPRTTVEMDTRMRATSPFGVLTSEVVDTKTPTVVVDIARAGILPSQICYDTLNQILEPEVVRQDHLIMARTVNDDQQVTGASIAGSKVGGPVANRHLLLPDPMGATGNSLATAIRSYVDGELGQPAKIITLNLIVTPEFVRRFTEISPEVHVYAIRLDRGASAPEALESVPGTHWAQESGLDEHDYIVPGGGGFGELMNNSWV